MRGLERRIPWRAARLSLLSLVALLSLAAPAFADTFHVQVGGAVPGVPVGDLSAYYPQRTWVHVGDQVVFDFQGAHTVTFPVKGQPLPSLVQPVLPPTPYPATNDAAGQPFWWGGVVPQLGLNPQLVGPAGGANEDGSQLTGSGAFGVDPGVAPSFALTFTRVGAFQYGCGLHANMRGSVHVRAAGNPVPSPAAQTLHGQEQMAADIAAATHRSHEVSEIGSSSRTVLAGSGARDFSLLAFYPSQVDVKVGQRVTFRMGGREEVHTVTFGDDSVVAPIDMNLFGPPPGLVVNPQGILPSDPGSPPAPLSVSLTSHGNGFANSGFMFDPGTVPNQPNRFSVVFTQPGTYNFECLIHDFMKGTVTVHA